MKNHPVRNWGSRSDGGEEISIGELRRALYGRRSERKERLLNQLELALDELTASATEDELAAEKAAARTTEVKGFVRRKPSRKPFPEHLPREHVVVLGLTSCACCGSERLSKVARHAARLPDGSRIRPTHRFQ